MKVITHLQSELENDMLSKVQHQNFEPGEFVDICYKNYHEIISLIEDFPWNKERDRIIIALTNPSITIEDEKGNYLKLALFFNGKYVLHYFDKEQHLYTKSFTDYRGAYPYIQSFLEEGKLNLKDFKKEYTWNQHNLIHFATKDFHYFLTKGKVRKFMWGQNFASLLCTSIIAFIVILAIHRLQYATAFFLIIVSSPFWVFNLLLSSNYYNYAKRKMLYMTKGENVFYYGDKSAPTKYNKEDILKVVEHAVRGRNVANGFSFLKIHFENGDTIKIPNILVNNSELRNKLYMCNIILSGRPYMKKEA